MNIFGTQYTLQRRAYEIYVAGCSGIPKHCEGCHSPHTWDFSVGKPFDDKMICKINKDFETFGSMIDNIMIFGGEPLDQKISDLSELLRFCLILSQFPQTPRKVWLFTHYTLEEALAIMPSLIHYVDYIKCGAYEPSLACDNNIQYGITLATSNQYIIDTAEYKIQKNEKKERTPML